jgi:hypothetical protein
MDDPKMSLVPYPEWESSKTEDDPWPRGWHRAPARPLRCVFDKQPIAAGEALFATGREGECYCKAHASYAPTHVMAPPKVVGLS